MSAFAKGYIIFNGYQAEKGTVISFLEKEHSMKLSNAKHRVRFELENFSEQAIEKELDDISEYLRGQKCVLSFDYSYWVYVGEGGFNKIDI